MRMPRTGATSEVARRVGVPARRHPAGAERSTRRGGHSWVGPYERRWATARPDPATGSRNPERGLG